MTDIVTIGWLTIDDIVLTEGACLRGVRGGGALYSAVGARIWNDHVGIHAVAGRPYVEETRRQIARRGIDTRGIGRGDGNGLELWLLHESEVRKQQVPKLSSSRALDVDRERGALSDAHRGARGFHIAPQGPDSSIANARQCAGLASRPVVTLDILSDGFISARAYEDLSFLPHLTAFLPSEAEIEAIWAPSGIAEWLRGNALRHGCHMVAKLGARGSLVCEGGTGALTHVPAFPAATIDTTGAGDGYCGGFLAGLVSGRPLAACAAMGTVSASYIVEAHGALATHEPTVEERDERFRRVLTATRAFAG